MSKEIDYKKSYEKIYYSVAKMLTNNRDSKISANPHELLYQWDKIRDESKTYY